MATAYIGTTIPVMYTGRPAQRLIEAARLSLTKIWWDGHRNESDLVCSQTVIDKCSKGNAEMAAKRLELLEGIPLLELTQDVATIAENFFHFRLFPRKPQIGIFLLSEGQKVNVENC